jgi:hypothetical protein
MRARQQVAWACRSHLGRDLASLEVVCLLEERLGIVDSSVVESCFLETEEERSIFCINNLGYEGCSDGLLDRIQKSIQF